MPRCYHAIKGLSRSSLAEIWKAHHLEDPESALQDSPPIRVLGGKNIIEYDKPGKDFVTFATDSQHIMQVFMTACEHRGIQPM